VLGALRKTLCGRAQAKRSARPTRCTDSVRVGETGVSPWRKAVNRSESGGERWKTEGFPKSEIAKRPAWGTFCQKHPREGSASNQETDYFL
jgi:hypothetical protein